MLAPGPVDDLKVHDTFLRLIANEPNGNTLMRALCQGPMAAYQAVAAALHTVDGDRLNLQLVGHHGFTPLVAKFQSVPVDWDFPITQVFHSGRALFVDGVDIDGSFPLLHPGRALLTDDATTSPPLGVTLIALPVFYAGALTAVCSLIVKHDSPWIWQDYSTMEGTCAALGLWQRIAHLTAQPVVIGNQARVRKIADGGLTERQLAIVELIREGKNNASIAKTLGYSLGTVKAEVQTLLSLLSASDRREIVLKADRAGISSTARDQREPQTPA